MGRQPYRVIDVDGHTFEPDDLWEQYLPKRFHERRPRLIRDERNTTRYKVEDRIIPPGTGRGAWVPEGMRESSVHREGAVDPKLRLEDMDIEGIDVAVLYGVVSLGFYAMEDRELCNAVCRAYNDWLADYCSADPARLKGTPSLPLKWIDDACAEAERSVRDLGFVSITVPCAVGDRNADHRDNDPLYALAESLDVPVGFHAGGGRFAHSKFVDSYAQLHALEFPFNIMFGVTTVVCGGVLERFKTLRVAMLEAGVGWAPYFIERLDEHYEHRPNEMPHITKAPSEYLAEGRLFISTEGEDSLPHAFASLGSDYIVWASDYPHWDSSFPDSVTKVTDRTDITDAQKQALFETNAERLYGWSR
ncbi:MAG TPA: amidohydrolase family protein [Acidimicrobiales bacterium]|nr:amidohydrolase family protein [Acidimicrobiales bacterium]